MQEYITQAQPDMRLLTDQLLDSFHIGLDHQAFWAKMVKESNLGSESS
jgi:hypothetical protein